MCLSECTPDFSKLGAQPYEKKKCQQINTLEMNSNRRAKGFSSLFLWRNGGCQAKSPQNIQLDLAESCTGEIRLLELACYTAPEMGVINRMSSEVARMKTQMRLPDYIQPGLRIMFVGINPGLRSAETGHHFAGYSNRFWKLLFESKLVSEPITYKDDWRLPEWRLGLTNIIRRPSAGIHVLRPSEYAAGQKRLLATVKRSRPRIVALLGVTIYRTLFPHTRARRISLGLQSETLDGTPVFVLPNPSGRNALYSYRAMLTGFVALRKATRRPFKDAAVRAVPVGRHGQM